MISRFQFDSVVSNAASNLMAYLPKMILFKSTVQNDVLNVITPKERDDVRYSRLNQSLIDKLCRIAHREWLQCPDAESLYSAAIAVATIIKEYEWGTQYLLGDGLWEIADRIQKA